MLYNSFPTASNQSPDFSLGSPAIHINTLDSIQYIQNPVVTSNGSVLIASSDFDKSLWIWKNMPKISGVAPDTKISLTQIDLAPWDNALFNNKLVLAGRK